MQNFLNLEAGESLKPAAVQNSQSTFLPSRRTLLKGASLAAVASGCGRLEDLLPENNQGSEENALPASHWQTFPSSIKSQGRLILPSNSKYLDSRRIVNPRFDIRPQAIVYCQTELEVSQTVKWARALGHKVTVRSGGHNYEGFCMNKDLVIDVSGIKHFKLNANTMTIGAGWKQGELLNRLFSERPNSAAVMGSCKSVGLSGFALGGGFGFLSRKHGLGVDNIVSLNVVLANGEIVKADAQTNSELFWALRGGGGSFGIVTSMEYRVHQVPPVVTTFYKSFSLSEAKRIVPIWFEWVKNMPPEFVTIMNFNGGNGGGSLTIVGQYLGSANELLSTNLPNWGIPMEPWLRERSYLEAVNYFNGGEETGVSRHFRARSDYYLKPLNNAGIDGIVNLLQATGNPWSYAFLFDSYGAAINNVSQNATAFAHRQNILCSMQLYMSWGDTTVGPHPQDNNSAIRVKAIGEMLRQTGNVSGRAYPNYADATRSDWQTAYYGENLGRLKAAKAQFDSENYFRFEQSIKA